MKSIHFLKALCLFFCCLGLTSCGYYCTLISRGNSPLNKTYYITSSDSTTNRSLEFKEYANILKKYLDEIGYSESSPQEASLVIKFDYEMGEAYLFNSTTTAKTKISINSTAKTEYEKSNTYRIPLSVSIKAFDNQSGEPIWEVIVRDELNRETQIQSVMPWLLLGTKEYIGKSSKGEQKVKITNKEIREKYNLVWP